MLHRLASNSVRVVNTAGVPIVVVPFGRHQLEVARHVEVAGAGVRLMPKKLTPTRLREAVRAVRERKPGAETIAAAFRAAGGPTRAADAFEQLLPSAMTDLGAVAQAPGKPPDAST